MHYCRFGEYFYTGIHPSEAFFSFSTLALSNHVLKSNRAAAPAAGVGLLPSSGAVVSSAGRCFPKSAPSVSMTALRRREITFRTCYMLTSYHAREENEDAGLHELAYTRNRVAGAGAGHRSAAAWRRAHFGC